MVRKDILNFIYYHNQTCLDKINDHNINIFINKYERILNENYTHKYSVEYIRNSLRNLKESKYINSFIYNQINEFMNNINDSFFNKVISIILLDDYDEKFIEEAKKYGFELNTDNLYSENIKSIEIATFENIEKNKNIINLSDFNIQIIKKYISLMNSNFCPSKYIKSNEYNIIKNEYENISKLDARNIINITKTFDSIIDKIISYISKIQLTLYNESSIENTLNLNLSLLIEIYCKMKKFLLLNSDNDRIMYLSILKNIGKINDLIDKISSELSIKMTALLRVKRTLIIMADNIKGGY